MEIEETLAAQLHVQPEQQQSYFNPENTSNKTASQFEIQNNNTTHQTEPQSNSIEKEFPQKQTKVKIQATYQPVQQFKKTKHSQSFSNTQKLSLRFDYKNVQKIDERDQNANKDYKDLTLKLQSALKKINSKNQKNTKLNGEEIINRFKKLQEKKKKEIHQKKQHTEQNKAKDLQDKPTINQYSEKIAKEIGHKPIHLRLEQLMAQKKRKMEQNQQLKKKQEEQEQQVFLQEYNKHTKRPENLRSYQTYFNEMVRWKEKKTKEMKQKLQNQKSKELEGITFTPSLNQKSLKMVSSHHRLPIEQRGLLKKKQTVQIRKQKFKIQSNQK